MKEDVQALDTSRLQLVEKLNQVDSELLAATARHNAELQEMWRAENQVAEMRAVNETLGIGRGRSSICDDQIMVYYIYIHRYHT